MISLVFAVRYSIPVVVDGKLLGECGRFYVARSQQRFVGVDAVAPQVAPVVRKDIHREHATGFQRLNGNADRKAHRSRGITNRTQFYHNVTPRSATARGDSAKNLLRPRQPVATVALTCNIASHARFRAYAADNTRNRGRCSKNNTNSPHPVENALYQSGTMGDTGLEPVTLRV